MLRSEQIARLKERTWQWEAKESAEKAFEPIIFYTGELKWERNS